MGGPALGLRSVFGDNSADARDPEPMGGHREATDVITLFLCGDVMTGRGVDQVLPHPGDPRLFEPYVRTASTYVRLAEAKNGPIQSPVEASYVWGDALTELHRANPDARIVNLETSVTTSGTHWRGKGIHYRMHPDNVSCLTVAGVDCCVLANNHVLDWGRAGLRETLDTLRATGIATAGAGADLEEATAPAVMEVGTGRRVLVFAFGVENSGIPKAWAATASQPGVSFVSHPDRDVIRDVAERVRAIKRAGDVVVASIHWGGNWGYAVSRVEREFAHGLIDEAGIDVIHGHSSHHPRGIEVYRGRPILYGCGDFLNDYEGISGYEEFRGDLVLMYFLSSDPADGRLACLNMVPLQIRRFRLNRASPDDTDWLLQMLSREGEPFGTRVESGPEGTLVLQWE
jgi:poly-gamma-glutamate synthesis protein (capsule biosynthesis protein)